MLSTSDQKPHRTSPQALQEYPLLFISNTDSGFDALQRNIQAAAPNCAPILKANSFQAALDTMADSMLSLIFISYDLGEEVLAEGFRRLRESNIKLPTILLISKDSEQNFKDEPPCEADDMILETELSAAYLKKSIHLSFAKFETRFIRDELALKNAILNDRLSKAEGITRAKSKFLAIMSHEIRTPMNGVLGITDLLLNSELDEAQLEKVSLIRSSASSLIAVLNDILDFSKLELKKLRPVPISFNLYELLFELEQLFSSQLNRSSIEFLINFDENVPVYIVGDKGRLRQIITNLISNAVKFTLDGGGVMVYISRVEESDNAANDVSLRFSFADTGIGISEEDKARIFQSFEQVELYSTRSLGGTGLGLNICSQLVELMGGEMSLKSKKGIGSLFSFTCKVQKSVKHLVNSDQNLLKESKFMRAMPSLKVLAVEDNYVNQKVITGALAALGHQPVLAENGQQALDYIEQEDFDLVLMDCQMPIMDGYEATKIIRMHEDPGKRSIPVVAMTAHVLQEEKDLCSEVGMDDFLSKPIDPESLSKILYKAYRKGNSGKNPNAKS